MCKLGFKTMLNKLSRYKFSGEITLKILFSIMIYGSCSYFLNIVY